MSTNVCFHTKADIYSQVLFAVDLKLEYYSCVCVSACTKYRWVHMPLQMTAKANLAEIFNLPHRVTPVDSHMIGACKRVPKWLVAAATATASPTSRKFIAKIFLIKFNEMWKRQNTTWKLCRWGCRLSELLNRAAVCDVRSNGGGNGRSSDSSLPTQLAANSMRWYARDPTGERDKFFSLHKHTYLLVCKTCVRVCEPVGIVI